MKTPNWNKVKPKKAGSPVRNRLRFYLYEIIKLNGEKEQLYGTIKTINGKTYIDRNCTDKAIWNTRYKDWSQNRITFSEFKKTYTKEEIKDWQNNWCVENLEEVNRKFTIIRDLSKPNSYEKCNIKTQKPDENGEYPSWREQCVKIEDMIEPPTKNPL